MPSNTTKSSSSTSISKELFKYRISIFSFKIFQGWEGMGWFSKINKNKQIKDDPKHQDKHKKQKIATKETI